MGRLKLMPIFKEEDLGINPLIQSLVITVRQRHKKRPLKDINGLEIEDGEVTIAGTATFNDTFLVEKDTKGSYYCSSHYRLHVSACTPKAKSLLLWIMYEIEYGKDYIWINVDRYLEETNTSLNTYKDAITELWKESIIIPIAGYNNMYWTNPMIFFKGSRIRKYKSHVILDD